MVRHMIQRTEHIHKPILLVIQQTVHMLKPMEHMDKQTLCMVKPMMHMDKQTLLALRQTMRMQLQIVKSDLLAIKQSLVMSQLVETLSFKVMPQQSM